MKKITFLVFLLFLNACTKSLVIVSEIPRPLIERTPLLVKMHYSDEFNSYKYIEESEDRHLESVEFGTAQIDLFNQIFGNLFTLVHDASQEVDMNIEPQVLEFQYSIPRETKSSQFEIWLKYRIQVSDNKGTEIADWVVKGYGKTPKNLFVANNNLFNTASAIALRDVGAQLAIGFRTQPSIKDYLIKTSEPVIESPTDVKEPNPQPNNTSNDEAEL